MTPRLIFRSWLLGAVALVGCGGEDTRPPVWSYISPAIIQPNCATSSCHSRAAAVAGLDLSTAFDGYDTLMNQQLPGKDDGVESVIGDREKVPRQLVTKFNPSQSRLVNMLRATGANRMPPDRPLAEADIELIEEWILRGAKND